MKFALQRLEEWLKLTRPDCLESMNAAISNIDDELKVIERTIGRELPECIRTLYQWKDGQQSGPPVFNNYCLLPLEQAIWCWRTNDSIDLEQPEDICWMNSWFPFAVNGNPLCNQPEHATSEWPEHLAAEAAMLGLDEGDELEDYEKASGLLCLDLSTTSAITGVLNYTHDGRHRTVWAPDLESFFIALNEFVWQYPHEHIPHENGPPFLGCENYNQFVPGFPKDYRR